MTRSRAFSLGAWLLVVIAAAIVASRARYVADLSGFLPEVPDDAQQLLVDQLGSGPASRVVLIGIEQGEEANRLRLSRELALRLRDDPAFQDVANGGGIEADGEFLLRHRYLLSDAVDADHFSVAGLRDSVGATIDELGTTAGLALADLLPRDPTGEMAHLAARLEGTSAGPRSLDGVWVSGNGERALLVARTRVDGTDTDGQEVALDSLRDTFAALEPGASRLVVSGPAVFAVQARASIVREAMRLSLLGSALTLGLLLYVYRSAIALVLGMVPVATGAIVGVAAVALGFGAVHGLTLGFGITLIGEAVDYAIYLFVQLGRDDPLRDRNRWLADFWPTVRLGMLTSVCGFAALLFSGFPGLAQLGLYSVAGLLAAALVTRTVLPWLLPSGFRPRDVSHWGRVVRDATLKWRARRSLRIAPIVLACAAVVVLVLKADTLWQRELASLSPVPIEAQRLDGELRADLGAPDVRHVIVIAGNDREQVLQRSEAIEPVLQRLVEGGTLAGFDNPSRLLPSERTQAARRAALPDATTLAQRLPAALTELPLRPERLQPFLEDVAAARDSPSLTPASFDGTSFASAIDTLLQDGRRGWHAMLPLRLPSTTDPLDSEAVAAALSAAGVDGVRLLDLKDESDTLYRDYLGETVRLALLGFAALVVLLAIANRSAVRTLRIVAPLLLAVLCTAALLVLVGRELSLLNVVGLLLTVAIGSNYALFFDGADGDDAHLDTPQT
ncbi:hypothetical protein EON77_02100, partial [bacterium]